MVKGLTTVKIIRFTPNRMHVWVEYMEGEKKGLICKKPASIIPTEQEQVWIKEQNEETATAKI